MAKRFWRIRGYKGFDPFFDETIAVGCMTEEQLIQLMKCLSAKATLTYDEIIGAYVKRKTCRAHSLLEIRRNGPYPEFHSLGDPYFISVIVDEQGNRITYPRLP